MDTNIDILTFRGMLNNAQNKIQYRDINLSDNFIDVKVEINGKLFDVDQVESEGSLIVIKINKEDGE